MQGCLCIKGGVLFVGNHARTASVQVFDLDGRRLQPGFRFGGREGASASGIAVDDDRRVWVADTRARSVRAFTLFGNEIDGLTDGGGDRDRAGCLGPVADVAAAGVEQDQILLVATGGWRRHAAQVWRSAGRLEASLRPLGDPDGRFHDVVGVALAGRLAYVCEARAGRIQVFRDGDFHFALRLPGPQQGSCEPRAVAPLPGGRIAVAVGGEPSALLLLDGAGRLVRTLAGHGVGDGQVFEPADVAAEEDAGSDRQTRLAVIDRDGERVQVFTVEGACYGAFSP